MDRSSVSPHDVLLAFIAARDHIAQTGTTKTRMAAQWQMALGILDQAILESDKANPQDLDDLSYEAIKKDKG